MSIGHQWNDTDRAKPKYLEKGMSLCHLLQNKSNMGWARMEAGPLQRQAGE